MNKIITLLLVLLLTLSTVALAGTLRGREVADKLVGNTGQVFDAGCNEELPNAAYYFHENGRISARLRPCNLPADRAEVVNGRWQIQNNRFCISELGNFDAFCFGLNAVTEEVYRPVFFNPVMRQAWTLISIEEGNTFDLE